MARVDYAALRAAVSAAMADAAPGRNGRVTLRRVTSASEDDEPWNPSDPATRDKSVQADRKSVV